MDGRVSVTKAYTLKDDGFAADWTILNSGETPLAFVFGSEWNLYQIPSELALDGPRASLCGGRLRFQADGGAGLRAFPIETLSQSEKGYDIIHQGFCLLALWPVALRPGEAFRAGISFGE